MNSIFLKNPIIDEFCRLVESSQESLFLCSPFIKNNITELVIHKKRQNIRVDVLTSYKLANFYRRSSDLEALRALLKNNTTVKNLTSLHAKVYIFDKQKTIITSANLTNNGLRNNYEYGILIDDPEQTRRVYEDFSAVFNSDDVSNVTEEILAETTSLLEKVPRYEPVQFEKTEEDLFDAGTQYIETSLSGWPLDIFKVIKSIRNEIFSLPDVYKGKESLQKIHPDNFNIEAKIRQQLQVLRDRGLLEFTARGVYRKLWKD